MKQRNLALKVQPPAGKKINKIAIEGITAILLVMWIYTGISKIIDWYNFRYQLNKWDFFKSYSVLISYVIPSIELLIALLLVSKRTRKIGLWTSFFLMFIFTVYVAFVLKFAKEVPCTCGGIISELTWEQHLIVNIILTILSLLCIFLMRKKSVYT